MQGNRNGDGANVVAGGNQAASQPANRILTAKEVMALIEKNNRHLAMNRDCFQFCSKPGVDEVRARKA